MATNSEHLVSFQRLCANQHEHLPSNFKMEDVIFQRRLSMSIYVNAWTPCGGPVLGAGGEPKENYIYKSVAFTNRCTSGHAEIVEGVKKGQQRLSIFLDAVTSWTWQWWKLCRNMNKFRTCCRKVPRSLQLNLFAATFASDVLICVVNTKDETQTICWIA